MNFFFWRHWCNHYKFMKIGQLISQSNFQPFFIKHISSYKLWVSVIFNFYLVPEFGIFRIILCFHSSVCIFIIITIVCIFVLLVHHHSAVYNSLFPIETYDPFQFKEPWNYLFIQLISHSFVSLIWIISESQIFPSC